MVDVVWSILAESSLTSRVGIVASGPNRKNVTPQHPTDKFPPNLHSKGSAVRRQRSFNLKLIARVIGCVVLRFCRCQGLEVRLFWPNPAWRHVKTQKHNRALNTPPMNSLHRSIPSPDQLPPPINSLQIIITRQARCANTAVSI